LIKEQIFGRGRVEILIAHKNINNEELHFVLVDENYSDNDEPYTLFVYANHYSVERTERSREFFNTSEEAFEYCQQTYGINQAEWKREIRFTQSFQFEYGVTNLGVPQPYLIGFDDGKVIFSLSEKDEGSDNSARVLSISGNREGLQRLAAMLLLCVDGERFDRLLHMHLEDQEGYIFSDDMSVTLRSPAYFESLVRNELREGSVKTKIETRESRE
jgi:hypothetical protein